MYLVQLKGRTVFILISDPNAIGSAVVKLFTALPGIYYSIALSGQIVLLNRTLDSLPIVYVTIIYTTITGLRIIWIYW